MLFLQKGATLHPAKSAVALSLVRAAAGKGNGGNRTLRKCMLESGGPFAIKGSGKKCVEVCSGLIRVDEEMLDGVCALLALH